MTGLARILAAGLLPAALCAGCAVPHHVRVSFDNGVTRDIPTDEVFREGDRVIMLSDGTVGRATMPPPVYDVRVTFDNGVTVNVPTNYEFRDGDRVVMLSDGKVGPAPPVFQSAAVLDGFGGGGGGSYNVRLHSMKQVRFATVVRQEQDWSCGSAALATLLTHHYHHPMSEAQALEAMYARGNQAKIRREGFSLLDIKLFLESLGYQADGFETGLDRLVRANVPAIVIVNDGGYNHFVVVKGVRHGNVLLGDPAKGNRVVSRAAFEEMWENKILFVITTRRDGVAFNFSEDWRYMSAPLADAVTRQGLGALLLTRPGPNDF